MAGQSKKPITINTSVHVNEEVEVDIEIDYELLEQAISQLERAEVMSLFASVDVGVNIALAAEQCFYHYYGQDIPDCLRELITGATGRTM